MGILNYWICSVIGTVLRCTQAREASSPPHQLSPLAESPNSRRLKLTMPQMVIDHAKALMQPPGKREGGNLYWSCKTLMSDRNDKSCRCCGLQFAGGVARIKRHLLGGGDVRLCTLKSRMGTPRFKMNCSLSSRRERDASARTLRDKKGVQWRGDSGGRKRTVTLPLR